jgi:DNA-binding HxlR family transcriptional regulator
MISEDCSIEEFVETVKGKETWEVLSLAIDEATRSDRMSFRMHQRTGKALLCCQTYSGQLKQLINYLRYTVKPQRPTSKAYRLYMAHWGNA